MECEQRNCIRQLKGRAYYINKNQIQLLNMNSSFLSAIQPTKDAKLPSIEKSQILARFQHIYHDSLNKLTLKCQQQGVIQEFQNCYQQLKHILNEQSSITQSLPSSTEHPTVKSISNEIASQQELDPAIQQQQSEYLFLRNVWQSKYEPAQGYDAEDHIDRINKVVAMVRMRTNYMIKKESYVHEKEECFQSYLFENPAFMKMKQELEKMTMKNQELAQRCHFQTETISRLESQKSTLLENFTNMKKKYQQMEKSFIEISKKNISLEQDSLALKSQNTKNKLNSLRESTDFNAMTNMDLRRSTSTNRFMEEAKTTQRSTEPSQGNNKNQSSVPLENLFIDISLNVSSSREPKEQKPNNRYRKSDSQNEENTSINGSRQRNDSDNQNIQRMALCRSQKLITKESPLRLKYIRNDNTSTRRALLSSARSVDLADKTSLNKPKFERTKPNYQNLLKSVKKNDCVIETRIQRPSLLKNHYTTNDGFNSSKAFKDVQENLFQNSEVN